MSSINVDVDFFEHFKTRKLVGYFGVGAEIVFIRLLCFAAKVYPKDGVFKELDLKELIFSIGIKELPNANKIIEKMVEVKLLYKTKAGWYAVHEWPDYQGHIIAFKIRSQKANKKRWDNIRGEKEKKPMTDKEIEKTWNE